MDSSKAIVLPERPSIDGADIASRRLLLFAPGFAPHAFSESLVNSKLALAFIQHGWGVHVISRMDQGPAYSAQWQEPWTPLKAVTTRPSCPCSNRLNRMWDAIRQSWRMRYPAAGMRWAGAAFELALELHREKPFQAVLSRSPSDVAHVPALAFARKTGIPWIANWNDPPDHLWPEPYRKATRVVPKSTGRRLLLSVLRHARFVTFPCHRLRQHVLLSIGAGQPVCTRVIPHISLPGYAPGPRIQDGCFRICHAGNLSHERDPRTFFKGVAQFVKNAGPLSNFELRVLGVDHHDLVSLAADHGLGKYLRISPGSSFLESLTAFESSDVLLVLEAPCKEGIFLPSKVADYAQVGRPLLAVSPATGTLVDLIRETAAGEWADCLDPASVSRALGALYRSWRDKTFTDQYPTSRFRERFQPRVIVRAYEEMWAALGV